LLIACGIALLIMGAIGLYVVQQDAVRVSQIDIFGADASLSTYAKEALEGTYLGVVPRNSIFFYPEEDIRARIMRADSDVATVSIFRKGLRGLTVKVSNRVPIARWCGESYVPQATRFDLKATSTRSNLVDQCYVFDDSGFVFATTTSLPLVNSFAFYEAVASSTPVGVGSTLPNTQEFPAAFNFARELATFGSPVVAVVIRENEVDTHLASGTRLTYVLGREQDTYTALSSAKHSLNLADGSLDYVDLRFDGKMYLKKRSGDSVKK